MTRLSVALLLVAVCTLSFLPTGESTAVTEQTPDDAFADLRFLKETEEEADGEESANFDADGKINVHVLRKNVQIRMKRELARLRHLNGKHGRKAKKVRKRILRKLKKQRKLLAHLKQLVSLRKKEVSAKSVAKAVKQQAGRRRGGVKKVKKAAKKANKQAKEAAKKPAKATSNQKLAHAVAIAEQKAAHLDNDSERQIEAAALAAANSAAARLSAARSAATTTAKANNAHFQKSKFQPMKPTQWSTFNIQNLRGAVNKIEEKLGMPVTNFGYDHPLLDSKGKKLVAPIKAAAQPAGKVKVAAAAEKAAPKKAGF